MVSNKIKIIISCFPDFFFRKRLSYQRQRNRVQGKLATAKPDCKGQSWRKKWPLDRMSPPQRPFWRKPCKWPSRRRRPPKWPRRLRCGFARCHPCRPAELFLSCSISQPQSAIRVRWGLCNLGPIFNDFIRFSYDEKHWNSDFFEKTIREI